MTTIAAILLSLLALGWPILAIVVIGMVVHVAVVALVRRRWRAWWETSAAAAGAAATIYGAACFYGGFFSMDPEDPCFSAGYGYSSAGRQPSSMWPLSNPMCVSDSGTVDLVPAYVSPAIVGLLALAVACAVAAVLARRRVARSGSVA